MKISISYPPLVSKKGVACLGQNRQFQWFNIPTYIYPVIPAYAATLLEKNGYEVMWDDAIAEELSYADWKKRILDEKPDLIAIETKTPTVKMHWKIIDELKAELPQAKIVIMGDHVTARPEETLENSKADFVLTGGDFDFMLLNLANHLSKSDPLEGGFHFRDANGAIADSGSSDISKHDLDTLPLIDRDLTKWKLYAYKNGNFKYTPGAYMMSARDCWWGRCTFCAWTIFFPGKKFRTMSAEKALAEVENLISLGVKEIMEDSGSLPVGKWLEEFCQGMIEKGFNKKVTISCNMRITGIKRLETWKLMKKAGFRFILFGLESANQETLDRIDKHLRVEEIEPGLRLCKAGGLEPHITTMIGYPWETKEMAEKTISLAKSLFKKGYVDTLQGTIVIPYPGTPLYRYCDEKDLLLTRDYENFDQREMVMKSPLSSGDAKGLVQDLYKAFASPQFIMRKLISIRSLDDVKFIAKAGHKWIGKIMDYSQKDGKDCQ
ncbi:MAG: radical SAM protein [Candidatus Moranbacteria bacterium]|nr:radical SAM protein [Candidatus Moranbacteria bacterium]